MIAGTDYAVSPDIAWTEARDVWGLPLVYVAPIPDGPISVLPDMAALIWLALAEGAPDVVGEVAHVTSHPQVEVRHDIEAFVAELVERGLIRPV